MDGMVNMARRRHGGVSFRVVRLAGRPNGYPVFVPQVSSNRENCRRDPDGPCVTNYERVEGCIWLTMFPSVETVEALARIALDANDPVEVRNQATRTLGYRQLQEDHDAYGWAMGQPRAGPAFASAPGWDRVEPKLPAGIHDVVRIEVSLERP
jgi:hypothetical protein